ncbi:hypothetical protein H257_10220 [Aphanomyces astaci]|uniref:Uncharacterized protein n=1 Tax=Aphanomyces astaci TaxID=112090 RepID=W4G7U7_APHAT|nr:hypothetical protein H257_10220 [Aphanomyces astaci]ETV75366.1 hypothetical protein H257_10220 [Aphanomyces astaci]|eukprot:XP_009835000.1 hypothetical protein H257_10220 [Aphanomyces astaci]
MKTPATTHVIALVATACSHVVYGDTTTLHNATHPDGRIGPVFQFDFDHVGGLPSQEQLIVLSKWSPSELSSFADSFLSPRSPRHNKRSFSFRRPSSMNLNFTACDADD